MTFYVLGLGSFATLSFGFTGVYSHDLRWVFTLKITSYLFIVPLLVTTANPSAWPGRPWGRPAWHDSRPSWGTQ